jgi:hypothetical protein
MGTLCEGTPMITFMLTAEPVRARRLPGRCKPTPTRPRARPGSHCRYGWSTTRPVVGSANSIASVADMPAGIRSTGKPARSCSSRATTSRRQTSSARRLRRSILASTRETLGPSMSSATISAPWAARKHANPQLVGQGQAEECGGLRAVAGHDSFSEPLGANPLSLLG